MKLPTAMEKEPEAPANRARPLSVRVKRQGVVLVLIWVAVVSVSLVLNLFQARHHALDAARTQARSEIEKDVLYRRWNTQQGGVYGALTEATPANPYLNVPEREITTPSGKVLTMINPAYMTRQVHELGRQSAGVHGHITSLKPIRPENSADPWETAALRSFERGEQEASEFIEKDGAGYMRLMRPLPTEAACLQCHADQGYKVGDVRGGISVTVPAAAYLEIAHAQSRLLIAAHGFLGILGLIGLVLGTRYIHAQVIARERLVADLERTLREVNRLRSIVPICVGCKKIRDDQGFWEDVAVYMQGHMKVAFSHGLCPDCYQEELGKLDGIEPPESG